MATWIRYFPRLVTEYPEKFVRVFGTLRDNPNNDYRKLVAKELALEAVKALDQSRRNGERVHGDQFLRDMERVFNHANHEIILIEDPEAKNQAKADARGAWPSILQASIALGVAIKNGANEEQALDEALSKPALAYPKYFCDVQQNSGWMGDSDLHVTLLKEGGMKPHSEFKFGGGRAVPLCISDGVLQRVVDQHGNTVGFTLAEGGIIKFRLITNDFHHVHGGTDTNAMDCTQCREVALRVYGSDAKLPWKSIQFGRLNKALGFDPETTGVLRVHFPYHEILKAQGINTAIGLAFINKERKLGPVIISNESKRSSMLNDALDEDSPVKSADTNTRVGLADIKVEDGESAPSGDSKKRKREYPQNVRYSTSLDAGVLAQRMLGEAELQVWDMGVAARTKYFKDKDETTSTGPEASEKVKGPLDNFLKPVASKHAKRARTVSLEKGNASDPVFIDDDGK